MASEVDGPDVELVEDQVGERSVRTRAEPGGVGDQQGRTGSPQIVELQVDVGRRRNAHNRGRST